MKNILVPLDGSPASEQILPYVQWLAPSFQSSVTLLRVTDSDARPTFGAAPSIPEYLKQIEAKYFGAGQNVTRLSETGNPAEVIIDRAGSDPGCLIAMATHGVTGVRRWLMGSVASKVLQSATNPLLLIHPDEANPTLPVARRTLFVPLDGSALAEGILPAVIAWAKALNMAVHLLRVYALPPQAYIVTDGGIATSPAEFRKEMHEETVRYLDAQVDALRAEGVVQVQATVLEGDAAAEIIDVARRTPDNLIAMSTHGRSGIGRWVLGSVAERVIQHSGDPVLLLRSK